MASALQSTNASIQHSSTLNEALDVLRGEIEETPDKEQSVRSDEDTNQATMKLESQPTNAETIKLNTPAFKDDLAKVQQAQSGLSESPRVMQRPQPLDLGLYCESPEPKNHGPKESGKGLEEDSLAYSMDSNLRDSAGTLRLSHNSGTAVFGGKKGSSPEQTKDLLVQELQKSGPRGESLAASLNNSQASLASLALSHASLADSLAYSLDSSAGGSLQNSLAGASMRQAGQAQPDKELSQSIRAALASSEEAAKNSNVSTETMKTQQSTVSKSNSSAAVTGSQLEMFTAAVAGADGMSSSLQADLLAFLQTLPAQSVSDSKQADKPS